MRELQDGRENMGWWSRAPVEKAGKRQDWDAVMCCIRWDSRNGLAGTDHQFV